MIDMTNLLQRETTDQASVLSLQAEASFDGLRGTEGLLPGGVPRRTSRTVQSPKTLSSKTKTHPTFTLQADRDDLLQHRSRFFFFLFFSVNGVIILHKTYPPFSPFGEEYGVY